MNTTNPFEKRVLNSRFFKAARQRAEQVARNPEKIREMVTEARQKADKAGIGPIRGQWDSLMTILRMLRAYARGEYREISIKGLVTVLAAVAYFIMPFDVIPDFILGSGMLDDMVVFTWALNAIRKDVEHFSLWEARQDPGGQPDERHSA